MAATVPPIWDLTTIGDILNRSLYILNWFTLLVAIFSTIAAGVYYISGFMNEANVKQAKKVLAMTYAGLIVVLLARLILTGPAKLITGRSDINVPTSVSTTLPGAPEVITMPDVVVPSYVPAYSPDPANQGSFNAFFGQKINDLHGLDATLMGSVLNLVSIILGSLAVIYLVYNGIRYITANGNAETVKQARSGITFAVLGIIIVVTSYTIIQVLYSVASYLATV